MDIKNARELAKVIALCRKKGVKTCKISPNSIEFTLSDFEPRTSTKDAKIDEAEASPVAPVYSPEDVLFWSSGGSNVGGN